jgi:hypothetical protein
VRTEEELGGGVVIGHSLHQDTYEKLSEDGVTKSQSRLFRTIQADGALWACLRWEKRSVCGAEFIGVGASEVVERCAVWGS